MTKICWFPRSCLYFVEIYYRLFCLCLNPDDRQSTITLKKRTNIPKFDLNAKILMGNLESILICDSAAAESHLAMSSHALKIHTHMQTATTMHAKTAQEVEGGTKGQSSRNAALMARLPLFTTNLANQTPTWWTANLELSGMETEEGRSRVGWGGRGEKKDFCACVYVIGGC